MLKKGRSPNDYYYDNPSAQFLKNMDTDSYQAMESSDSETLFGSQRDLSQVTASQYPIVESPGIIEASQVDIPTSGFDRYVNFPSRGSAFSEKKKSLKLLPSKNPEEFKGDVQIQPICKEILDKVTNLSDITSSKMIKSLEDFHKELKKPVSLFENNVTTMAEFKNLLKNQENMISNVETTVVSISENATSIYDEWKSATLEFDSMKTDLNLVIENNLNLVQHVNGVKLASENILQEVISFTKHSDKNVEIIINDKIGMFMKQLEERDKNFEIRQNNLLLQMKENDRKIENMHKNFEIMVLERESKGNEKLTLENIENLMKLQLNGVTEIFAKSYDNYRKDFEESISKLFNCSYSEFEGKLVVFLEKINKQLKNLLTDVEGSVDSKVEEYLGMSKNNDKINEGNNKYISEKIEEFYKMLKEIVDNTKDKFEKDGANAQEKLFSDLKSFFQNDLIQSMSNIFDTKIGKIISRAKFGNVETSNTDLAEEKINDNKNVNSVENCKNVSIKTYEKPGFHKYEILPNISNDKDIENPINSMQKETISDHTKKCEDVSSEGCSQVLVINCDIKENSKHEFHSTTSHEAVRKSKRLINSKQQSNDHNKILQISPSQDDNSSNPTLVTDISMKKSELQTPYKLRKRSGKKYELSGNKPIKNSRKCVEEKNVSPLISPKCVDDKNNNEGDGVNNSMKENHETAPQILKIDIVKDKSYILSTLNSNHLEENVEKSKIPLGNNNALHIGDVENDINKKIKSVTRNSIKIEPKDNEIPIGKPSTSFTLEDDEISIIEEHVSKKFTYNDANITYASKKTTSKNVDNEKECKMAEIKKTDINLEQISNDNISTSTVAVKRSRETNNDKNKIVHSEPLVVQSEPQKTEKRNNAPTETDDDEDIEKCSMSCIELSKYLNRGKNKKVAVSKNKTACNATSKMKQNEDNSNLTSKFHSDSDDYFAKKRGMINPSGNKNRSKYATTSKSDNKPQEFYKDLEPRPTSSRSCTSSSYYHSKNIPTYNSTPKCEVLPMKHKELNRFQYINIDSSKEKNVKSKSKHPYASPVLKNQDKLSTMIPSFTVRKTPKLKIASTKSVGHRKKKKPKDDLWDDSDSSNSPCLTSDSSDENYQMQKKFKRRKSVPNYNQLFDSLRENNVLRDEQNYSPPSEDVITLD